MSEMEKEEMEKECSPRAMAKIKEIASELKMLTAEEKMDMRRVLDDYYGEDESNFDHKNGVPDQMPDTEKAAKKSMAIAMMQKKAAKMTEGGDASY